jgi:hypothetical protein
LRLKEIFSFPKIRILLEILFFSLYSKVCILFLPFDKFSKTFGALVTREELRSQLGSVANLPEIFRNIERVSRYLPWSATCLVQAHTAALMLRRRGQSFYTFFGVRKGASEDTSFNAHAWIEINESLSLGKDKQESFGTIASYFYSGST